MTTHPFCYWSRVILLAAAVVCSGSAWAQPFIVSVVPANNASGVSPSAAVVFTFSEEMDTALTQAQFFQPPFTPLPTTQAWSANNTVLTCTPTPSFPANQSIIWLVNGESLTGEPIDGEVGTFTTGGSGGGGGSGTNRLTSFIVGKIHFYDQTSAGAPTLEPEIPYFFTASTTLASNRTATGITLTTPPGGVSNLTQNFVAPENYFLFGIYSNLTAFNAAFPAGNYVFNVMASTSNQNVTVNLPAGMTQPNAPHVANYAAAQAINPAQPFQLTWDAFQGGTTFDHISLSIGDTFETPDAGSLGALNGTATSFTIPAGTLQPGSNYNATLTFTRSLGITNSNHATSAFISTSTDFHVNTSGVVTPPVILTNASWSNGTFSFDVRSAPGQGLVIEFSSTLLTNQWATLLTTNNASGSVRVSHTTGSSYLFYRARKNP
jgi:hypothetical protein